MRRKIGLILLCVVILLPSFVGAKSPTYEDIKRVRDRGYLGKGGLDLDRKINRAELATVAIRLLGLEKEAENFKGQIPFKDVNGFQKGWATPYIALAHREGIIQGVGPTTFNPSGQVSYVEMLTIFMRILGYEDGMDFVNYPKDHYTKAMEIGLASVYMDTNAKVTRGDVALTLEKLLDLPMKGEEITLLQKLDKISKPTKKEEKIQIRDLHFNTSIAGVFKGRLIGREDFRDYKVELISREDSRGGFKIYDKVSANEDGVFKIQNFDIGLTAKIRGYGYRIYDGYGNLVLEGILRG